MRHDKPAQKAKPPAHKQAAYRRGLRQEAVAAWLLRLKGFSIVERRYRSPYGEIDLVARRGRLVVFAEIKARPSEAEAWIAISAKQRERIERASLHFLSAKGWTNDDLTLRYDAIACLPRSWPRHLADAWRSV